MNATPALPLIGLMLVLIGMGTRCVFFTRQMQQAALDAQERAHPRFDFGRKAAIASDSYLRWTRVSGWGMYVMALVILFALWKGRWN